MACCMNVACFFCALCVLVGLASLIQLCLGVYLTFIQSDAAIINRLVKTDQFDSYLFYILLVFIGLGLISLALAFFSIYSTVRRLRSLAVFVAVLWVFTMILNIVMLAVSLLYYFLILPQLGPLLTRTLQQTPLSTSNLLDTLQLKYTCCGISNKEDYNNLPLDPFPASCCRVPYCWRDTDINSHNGSNNTISLMHTNGCYPIIEKYVKIELWILVGVTAGCALLQLIAILFMCVLSKRFRKSEDDPKFTIQHLGTGLPFHANQGSAQTIEETMEITQI